MTPITDTQADAILAVLAHEYDRNPAPFVRLMEELRALGEVQVPAVSIERGLRRVLGEVSHATTEAWHTGSVVPHRESVAWRPTFDDLAANPAAAAHPVQEADSPFSPEGIAGRSPSDLPGLRLLGAEMPVGVRE